MIPERAITMAYYLLLDAQMELGRAVQNPAMFGPMNAPADWENTTRAKMRELESARRRIEPFVEEI